MTHQPAEIDAQQPSVAAGIREQDGSWVRVSPKFAWVDLVLNLLRFLILALGYVVIVFVVSAPLPWWVHAIAATVLVTQFISAVLSFRRVRAIGYQLREDDFLFRRGILFERIIAVPYGRLQLVDVTRGPLLRALGLAKLKFITASAATGVQLPGLTFADAEQLRDRLVALAETRRSGL